MSLGGQMVGGPGASQGVVAVRGVDDAIWFRLLFDPSWTNWMTVANGRISADPAVMMTRPDAVPLFVARGLDGALWAARFDRSTQPLPRPDEWDWSSQGGILRSGPAASCFAPAPGDDHNLYVVDARGADDALWSRVDVADPSDSCF